METLCALGLGLGTECMFRTSSIRLEGDWGDVLCSLAGDLELRLVMEAAGKRTRVIVAGII